MIDDLIEDMLGGPSDGPVDTASDGAPNTNLPESTPRERASALRGAIAGRCFVEAKTLMLPVTRQFLGEVFQMDPKTVRTRLLKCRVLHSSGNREVYDFREAVAYLVPPKMDIEQYMRSLDAAKLPNHINKMFWEALSQRLKYMIAAGDAWATEDVLEVFGEVFITIKDRLQLWTETMRERGRLTDDQMALLGTMIEDLQSDLHASLVEIPSRRRSVPVGEKPTGAGDVEITT